MGYEYDADHELNLPPLTPQATRSTSCRFCDLRLAVPGHGPDIHEPLAVRTAGSSMAWDAAWRASTRQRLVVVSHIFHIPPDS